MDLKHQRVAFAHTLCVDFEERFVKLRQTCTTYLIGCSIWRALRLFLFFFLTQSHDSNFLVWARHWENSSKATQLILFPDEIYWFPRRTQCSRRNNISLTHTQKGNLEINALFFVIVVVVARQVAHLKPTIVEWESESSFWFGSLYKETFEFCVCVSNTCSVRSR